MRCGIPGATEVRGPCARRVRRPWSSIRPATMRALYADGRQAEALTVFEDARRGLAEATAREARDRHREALAIAVHHGDLAIVAEAAEGLAGAALLDGDAEQAGGAARRGRHAARQATPAPCVMMTSGLTGSINLPDITTNYESGRCLTISAPINSLPATMRARLRIRSSFNSDNADCLIQSALSPIRYGAHDRPGGRRRARSTGAVGTPPRSSAERNGTVSRRTRAGPGGSLHHAERADHDGRPYSW